MRAARVLRAGDRSLLLEFETLDRAMSAHRGLIERPVPGQLDAIAGARTVLLRLSGHVHAERARAALERAEFAERRAGDAKEVVIDVVYDGPDLADAAEFLGMSIDSLVAWHSGTRWLGAFPGFAGFTYCVAPDESFQMPRRASPRTAVPGGSVGLAGEFSAVYPRTGPGGWQLIGRTGAAMWDLDREPPALVQPWDAVTYRPVRAEVVAAAADAAPRRPDPPAGREALEVLSPGLQTLVEDFGREGSASLGAGLAGVMDREAARDANHAVGNPADAAVLEVLLGGFRARGLSTSVLAVSGADLDVTVRAEHARPRAVGVGEPFALLAGETVELGPPRSGARSVVAVRGGVVAHGELGSASTDTYTGIGPAPVAAGDVIRAGRTAAGAVVPAGRSSNDAQPPEITTLRVVFGPRDDWFSSEELQRFLDQRWIVAPASNRIGIRLGIDPAEDGARPLERERTGELLSEGMALGSVQVPPTGTPVLLVNDQGITGGYPVIAVVLAQDLPRAAQLAPGSAVRFRAVDPATLEPLPPEAVREPNPAPGQEGPQS